MKLSKVRIKNFRSIKDSNDINFNEFIHVLAGQNESGKSSILEAIEAYEKEISNRNYLNFELETKGNYLQEISCTFNQITNNDIDSICNDIINDTEFKENPVNGNKEVINYVNKEKLYGIKEFTLTRKFDFSINDEVSATIVLDSVTLAKFTAASNVYKVVNNDLTTEKNVKYFESGKYNKLITDAFWGFTPIIVLFNDFSTLLPDKILLDKIEDKNAEGFQAVKNIENLLSVKFVDIAKKEDRHKISLSEVESDNISIQFQDDWQQRIFGSNTVKITFKIQYNKGGQQEIIFSVITKDNEILAPKMRSKGMIWFLSLWLELKAREKKKNLVLLFDEPGLHLHVKANRNMLEVFNKLIIKGHQIIYSTHSPSLINTDNLNKIGLVINDIKHGTIVEGLTTSKINSENRKEALQPVAEAMGLEPMKDISLFSKKNVLVEGLSDFWIIKGFQKLLGRDIEYTIVPGVGVKGSKITNLISFCIGYGFDWVLIMDGGEIPKNIKETLKNDIFSGDEKETENRVFMFPVDEIENLFDINNLPLIDSSLKTDSKKTAIEIIGKNRKIVFSKIFYEQVEKGLITKSNMSDSTIEYFEKMFNWIDKQFSVE